MKVENSSIQTMTPALAEALYAYRAQRHFDAQTYVASKVKAINEYFTRNKLDTAVIGLSGGVDSALAYNLLIEAQLAPRSPLRRVVPVLVPAQDGSGATRQDEGLALARETCRLRGQAPCEFTGLADIVGSITAGLHEALDLPHDEWAEGQIVSYARTPIFYGATSFLTAAGYSPLVVGTTNLVEGAYLGFVGKASDAMVDLQIIADLYKSEVYATASLLGVPSGVLDATPTGDMWDGRTDETVFGASYDFAELYHHWLQDGKNDAVAELPGFTVGAEHLERLHAHNAHKYHTGSPSVFLNLYPCDFPGGWKHEAWA